MTYTTLKQLAASHPGVSGIESCKRGAIQGWNPDTKVLVSLKPGWFNMRHDVNVVIGANAAEVLEYFNSNAVTRVDPSPEVW